MFVGVGGGGGGLGWFVKSKCLAAHSDSFCHVFLNRSGKMERDEVMVALYIFKAQRPLC